LLSVIFVIVLMTSLAAVFLDPFHALENAVAMKSFQYTITSLQNEMKFLDRLLVDWSAWDATANFVQGKNPDYIKENLPDITQQEQNLNVFCFLDVKGKLVWSRCVQFHDKEVRTISLSMFTNESLQKNYTLWNHKTPDSSVTGYCSTEGGILMLASRPITDNNKTGPIYGTLIMGRFVTGSYLTEITKQTCLSLEWWNLKHGYTHLTIGGFLSQITPQNPVFLEYDENNVAAYTTLPDIDGSDAVLIKSTMPNNVVIYKNEFLTKGVLVFLIESPVFFITLIIGVLWLPIRNSRHTEHPVDFLPHKDMSCYEHTLKPQNASKEMFHIESRH
jgi:sensor domain CHASE-containing protein